jgi:7-cyano-7-deazaguanine synthase
MDGASKPTAIILLSGGIDSFVAAAMMRRQYELIALTIEYGQPVAEKVAAIMVADWLRIPTRNKPLVRIPSFNAIKEPSHYFPMRNLILLAHAAQIAEQRGAKALIVGANFDDHCDYWDCRQTFFEKLNHVLEPVGIVIEYPLAHCGKAEVVRRALEMKLPLQLTLSCYRPMDRTPCGTCNACLLRKKAYEANGLEFKLERLPVDLSMWGRE